MAADRRPDVWAVVGATGTGKTEFSLDLAERLSAETRLVGAEIVNADAMQLYRGMDIGTAKVGRGERRGIPHHLLDALEPSEEASVAWYQQAARTTIEGILARGRHAILVGGSGLYVSSVVFDFHFPPRDEELRAVLEDRLALEGVSSLLLELREVAPAVAAAVDASNPRRVVRALEAALLGGDARVTLPEQPTYWYPNTRVLGLRVPREELVQRLDRRVERMWADGLVDEVRELIPRGVAHGKTASQAIGYAQALAQLDGKLSEAEAIAETQRLTRRFARRQVSWFKRYPGIEWLDAPTSAAAIIDA